ncbi:MAG: hypothetical protein IJW06_06380 [Clostridia bacterium]|nr:hypothetical protein [Clostridia bacterium]
MKNANQELNSIFYVAEEMVNDNGEDCFYHDVIDNKFIIASLDGCGGSGSKRYKNFSGKTGAYVASRAVCGGVKAWFLESNEEEDLPTYVQDALSVCKKYADKAGRIMGSLSKAFPTTAAIITGNILRDKCEITCYWAGDSRCYMLDAKGLHQLTEDDLDGQDAMSNLTNDGVMNNSINASTSFEIHSKKIVVGYPCILLTATDGCFGYLNSPMEFEYLLTDSLVKSKNITEWKIALNERMNTVTGDDYTLCVAVCGFADFEDIRNSFVKRNEYVAEKYLNSQQDVNDLWDIYKKNYSLYL